MPIKVSCKCGQIFTAKDELVGQTLLCPKCSQPLTIPAPGAVAEKVVKKAGIDDLFDEVGMEEVRGPRCPECGAPIKSGAVMCVSCGLKLETGERVEAAKIRKGSGDGGLEIAEMMMDRAAKEIEYNKIEDKNAMHQGTPAWMLFLILVIVLGFSGTMYFLPRDQAVRMTGYEVIALGCLISFINLVRIIITSFYHSLVHGFLCLLVPPYILIYAIMKWRKCNLFIMKAVGGGLVVLFGLGMIQVAPYFTREDAHRLPIPRSGDIIVTSSFTPPLFHFIKRS